MAKFEEGNPGGPGGSRPGSGRKPGVVSALGLRLFGGVSEDDLAAIIGKAVEQAKEGDLQARAWLFDRIFGRVVPTDLADEQQRVREEFEGFKDVVLDALAEHGESVREQVLLKIKEQTT